MSTNDGVGVDGLLNMRRDAWITRFREARKLIEAAIRASQEITPARESAVANADANLFGGDGKLVPFGDYLELCQSADLLEKKLQEFAQSLPEQGSLQNATCVKERRVLFIGGALEILHQYRDHGKALVLAQRDQLLDRLDRSVRLVQTTVATMNRYLIVEQLLDPEHLQSIEESLASARALGALYRRTLAPAEDRKQAKILKAMLKNDYARVKRQYLVACMRLTLQLYGHITRQIEESFLHLKVASDLDYVEDGEGHSRTPDDANRVSMIRARERALNGLLDRAKKQGWECVPILEAYIASTSRRRTRDAPQNKPLQDSGLHEHHFAL